MTGLIRLRDIEDYDLSRHDTVTFYRYAQYHCLCGRSSTLGCRKKFYSTRFYVWIPPPLKNEIPFYWVSFMCIDWIIFTKIVTLK